MNDMNVLLVTGTSDSGRAVARIVAESGGTVGLTYHSDRETAEALVSDLPGDGHTAWELDVTNQDQVSEVIVDAFRTLGTIDGIIYSVGVISSDPIEDIDSEDWEHHLGANVTGAFNVVKAASPELKSQGKGSIVAISAAEGVIRNPNLAAYDVSKRGLIALVEEAARELGPAGVRANVVSPGFIRDPEALSEEDKRDLYDQQSIDRLTTPTDIASTCLFLCSEHAAAITGTTITVDSGLSL